MQSTLWGALAGLGFLLYGMSLMEEIIKKLLRTSLQNNFEKYTKKKWSSFLLGIFATAAVQSSSLISLLLLIFVGAQLITFGSSIAVIVGSNIGTTFSSLLIAWLGFGKFSISAFALPLIAISGVLMLFAKKKKHRYYLKIIMSFGLIFFGIDMLKESVEGLKSMIDFASYAQYGVIGFFILGVIVTAIIQSSHTVVIMALAALDAGIISLPLAIGIVIGTNIGTTVTIIIASLGTNREKKKLAFAHLSFNVILSIIGLLYYPVIMLGIQSLVGNALTLTVQLAIFNTIINSCTALVTLPFLNQFAGIVEAISPKKSEGQHLHIQRLDGGLHEAIPGVQLRTLRLDTKIVIKEMINYMLYLFEMKISVAEKKKEKQLSSWSMKSFFKEIFNTEKLEQTYPKETIIGVSYDQETHKTMYETTKEHIDLIMKTLLPIKQEELNQIEQYEQDQLEGTIEDIVDVMKLTKNIREDILLLKPSDTKEEDTPYHILQKVVRTLGKTTLSILSSTDYEYKVELLSDTSSDAKNDLDNLNTEIIETIRHESSTKHSISTLLNIINHLQQLILFWHDGMSHLIHAQHKFKAMGE